MLDPGRGYAVEHHRHFPGHAREAAAVVEGDHLHAFCHLHQEEMAFRLSRIQGVRLLNERGWTPGAHSAAG